MSFSKTVPIQLGGKTRNLKYGFNALVDLEETLGVSIQDMMKMFASGAKLGDLRAILWAGMKHEEPGLTPEAVGDMIDGPDDFKAIAEAVRAAMEAAFPPTKTDGKKASPKN